MSKRHVLHSGKVQMHFLTSFVSQKHCVQEPEGFSVFRKHFGQQPSPAGKLGGL